MFDLEVAADVDDRPFDEIASRCVIVLQLGAPPTEPFCQPALKYICLPGIVLFGNNQFELSYLTIKLSTAAIPCHDALRLIGPNNTLNWISDFNSLMPDYNLAKTIEFSSKK